MIYGNPDLKSETSHNFSVSAEYTKNRYNFSVTGYYNLVHNRINTVYSEDPKGQIYTNTDKMDIAGIDTKHLRKISLPDSAIACHTLIFMSSCATDKKKSSQIHALTQHC